MTRFRDKHLYGTNFHLNGRYMFGYYFGISITKWPPIEVRRKFFHDMPYRYRWGGRVKPWNLKYEEGL